jgi:crotonobetainyl-CoA:carnitine CoA-transferase CaiB-like acyl-CoA transferase
MHAAFAMQVALIAREQTGTGLLVEAPLIESALNIAAEQVIEHSAYGALLGRHGNRSPGVAPQGVYPCQGDEQWLAISVATDEQWMALRKVLGEPAWAAPGLDTFEARRASADLIDRELRVWASALDLDEAVDRLISHGVPAGAVTDFRNISTHARFRERAFFEMCDHPVVGTHPIPGQPFRYSGIERWIRSHAPVLGQDNEAVLVELLGVSAAELSDLAAAGVIGDRPVG